MRSKKKVKEFAKELRQSMTKAECVLWRKLRNRQLLGRKFRRQHPVEGYILDFYCPEENLAIELDGIQHYYGDAAAYDDRRERQLKDIGIRILRFNNTVFLKNQKEAIQLIIDSFSDDGVRG